MAEKYNIINMIKDEFLKIEDAALSPSATKSSQTRGRLRPIKECEIRTEFQRDRDRILHCRSFRMLKHKTQVFLAPEGDYFRTRLTHTLEVSQIARTISRALRLNEDLTEAIALGHDLGHTPFGHAGERALAKCTGGFLHNEQSLRVVDFLEKDGKGLNLTWEVRDGILNHKKGMAPETLEGMVVNISDRIAYLNHDVDDALHLGALKQKDLPKEVLKTLGETHGERINTMICDVISTACDSGKVAMSEKIQSATDELRSFMFERVYLSQNAQEAEKKTNTIISMLYNHYMATGDGIKHSAIEKWGLQTAVSDYIAGMSDRFALEKFDEIFVPKIWI